MRFDGFAWLRLVIASAVPCFALSDADDGMSGADSVAFVGEGVPAHLTYFRGPLNRSSTLNEGRPVYLHTTTDAALWYASGAWNLGSTDHVGAKLGFFRAESAALVPEDIVGPAWHLGVGEGWIFAPELRCVSGLVLRDEVRGHAKEVILKGTTPELAHAIFLGSYSRRPEAEWQAGRPAYSKRVQDPRSPGDYKEALLRYQAPNWVIGWELELLAGEGSSFFVADSAWVAENISSGWHVSFESSWQAAPEVRCVAREEIPLEGVEPGQVRARWRASRRTDSSSHVAHAPQLGCIQCKRSALWASRSEQHALATPSSDHSPSLLNPIARATKVALVGPLDTITAFTLSRFYDRYNRTAQISNGRYVYVHASIDAALWHVQGAWAVGFLADIGRPSGLLLVVSFMGLERYTATSTISAVASCKAIFLTLELAGLRTLHPKCEHPPPICGRWTRHLSLTR